MINSPKKRADYIREHRLFAGVGERCQWGPWVLPLYPELIRLHNNVNVHKTAKFIPHDVINWFLRKTNPDGDFGYYERLGCIEIMDNVYISMNCVILPNVRINRNCIISAGSVVTGDIPENSIVAGNPARVVGRFDLYMAARMMEKEQNVPFTHQALSAELANAKWERFNADRLGVSQADTSDEQEEAPRALAETQARIREVLAPLLDGVDLEKETHLIDRHVLDSLGMITVVSALEDTFDCAIPFSQIKAEHFNSVSAMAKLMASLSDAKQTGSPVPGGASAERGEFPATALSPLALDEADTDKSVVQRILEHALRAPDMPAVVADDKATTYGRLADMILSISEWLAEKGVREGDVVCVQAVHDPVCVACYYGVHLLGAVLVPVEESAAESRILAIAEETKAKLIVSLKAPSSASNWTDYAQARANLDRARFTEDVRAVYPAPDTPCEMIFTTGTTGKSKGVLMTHRHIAWYVYSVAKCVEMKKNNRFLLTTPLNHAGGLRRTHLMLANGCCIVYLNGLKDLGLYFETIEKYRITSLYLPPVAVRILLVRTEDQLGRYRDQIDFVYCSSSPLPQSDGEKLRELLPRTRLYNAYEASETPGVSAYDFNTDAPVGNCLGAANEGVELAILPENGELTREPDVEGQICVKSKMNMKEYYLEPALTSSVFRGEWFVSSDLGSLDRQGRLFIHGRKGDVINIGGYKIAPTDVEETALRSGMVDECVCVEERDALGVPCLKLLAVAPDAQAFDTKALSAFLAEQLEAYKVPRKIELTDAIKKTFNGKIDRKAYR